jgi:hypothetical protein
MGWSTAPILRDWDALIDPATLVAQVAAAVLDDEWLPFGRPLVPQAVARRLQLVARDPNVVATFASSTAGRHYVTASGLADPARPVLAGLAVLGTAWASASRPASELRGVLERRGLKQGW